MQSKLILTLCYHCYTIYRDMPDREIKRVSYDIKEPCDLCKRLGYEYDIIIIQDNV